MSDTGIESLGNLLAALPDASLDEVFTDILRAPACRIERIVSQGQTTPLAKPYRQEHDEWVLVLAGRAIVEAAGHETYLQPGDHLFIPAGISHRVTYTDPERPTIWLAVHIGEAGARSDP